MRRLARLGAAAVAAAALALVPVGGAIAAAPSAVVADRGPDSSVTIPESAVPGVIAARKAYLQSASAISRTYRQAVEKARDSVAAQLADASLELELAKDALRVTAWSGADTTQARAAVQARLDDYKAAAAAARASVEADLDAARSTAKAALATAKADYVAAITAAFAGATVPPALLNPPRSGWGKHGMDWGMGRR